MCYTAAIGTPAALVNTALRSIVCYKVITKHKKNWFDRKPTYRSMWYKEHEWVLDEVYRASLVESEGSKYISIDEGFHSYINLNEATAQLTEYKNSIIIECEIPYGALFYCNPSNAEYVSDTIIMRKIL